MDGEINKHYLENLTNLKSKRIVLRVDWNLPMSDGKVTDLSRLNISAPFIKELSFSGAKVIILTHFGEDGESLEEIYAVAKKSIPFLKYIKTTDFEDIKNEVSKMENGDAILLQNTRMFKGETDNIPSLSSFFASLGDIFVNDAFSVSHRNHSSVVGVAKNMLSYFGPNFKREVENLSRVLNPEKPSLFIIGGAKISTKLPIIKRYLDAGVKVFVGGAMVHNILKERGVNIGKSLFDEKTKLTIDFINHPLLLTPIDVRNEQGEEMTLNQIKDTDKIVDCGKETVNLIEKEIFDSKTVIYNGPLGLYEKGYLFGTESVLINLSKGDAKSYIGGGDTVPIAHKLGILKKFTFVSLGGGAMLDFLSSGRLPGIDAVTKQQ